MAESLQSLTPLQTTILGSLTGFVDVSCTQWMLYSKTLSQQSALFANGSFFKCVTHEPGRMYRGYTTSLLNVCTLTALQFPLTSLTTNLITGGVPRRLTDSEMCLSAFTGGVASGFVCSPLELVMIQQQNFGGTLRATPSLVIKEFGVSKLFSRGLLMSCGREGIYTMGMLGVGPTVKRYGKEGLGMEEAQASMFAAVFGGVLVATVSHPMDTIKTCQQGDLGGKLYKDILGTFRVLQEDGVKRFFSGWSWRSGRMIVQVLLFDICATKLGGLLFTVPGRD